MPNTSLPKKEARQHKILSELGVFPQIKVSELSTRLGVSPETIRRDLAALAKQGRISRTFGGAVSLANVVPGIDERKNFMTAERDQISQIAIQQIEPNDLLLVGGGSTTIRFALKFVALSFPVTVVTHSLPFATIVSKNSLVSVEMLPGKLHADEGLTYGTNTLRAIDRFAAHKAFVGASGINERGLYALMEPGEVYAAMIEAAQETYLLIDSSKFGAASLAHFHKWNSSMTLICDQPPQKDLAQVISVAGCKLRLPDV
ncbi:DeoR/GlpR family DNA-binding transcription regulator [Rhodobacteraceae bacterium LMO-12]|nr:DeoR/GlpR family DNA-binding transcription regulator [Rhodobacteraceae bacterium LMO-JJ12]